MITEWTAQQMNEAIDAHSHTALYLYTPMCGTCQLAGRMLDIAAGIVPDYAYGKANLNYMESLAKKYQIESVPCLLIWKNGDLAQKIYAFESVPTIYETLKNHLL
ncbi:thioredoxin family protein [Jeotgalibacillus soli]|uniref:Thioredoxin n=1 Tax=Jeotgalibacillus soli TaxID=889306 RepID=A0A0C2RLN5_9BACL|nr:thioredoxin [Jeotgalibacillus soli]